MVGVADSPIATDMREENDVQTIISQGPKDNKGSYASKFINKASDYY